MRVSGGNAERLASSGCGWSTSLVRDLEPSVTRLLPASWQALLRHAAARSNLGKLGVATHSVLPSSTCSGLVQQAFAVDVVQAGSALQDVEICLVRQKFAHAKSVRTTPS